MLQRPGRVTAVLGPTNTGKTHYAIERMLAYRTGVIGLPLRLLAREVYDRIVALRGPSVVALVTGEERIVPDRTQYWVCTVEAMPMAIGADFVAIDEIQLCADPDRGHVFTERLLGARGLHETLFLGADTMRPAIAALVPGVQFVARERFSELTYSGSKKISRMPTRAAIVGFSVENVYAIAELIRRQKGGCAVVMGALSPRTRNAQVDIYQNGDVDYLVATDAIGMGLNLDVRHIAFSALSKFDGHRMRPLHVPEIAQIAGRAGRYMQPGTFGVTGEARPLDAEVIEAVENHQFAPVRKLHWRNGGLDFGSPDRLIASLESFTSDEWLTRVRESDDLRALKALTAMEEVRDRVRGAPDVTQLWDICRIPDFRGISPGEHAALLARIHSFVHDGGRIPTDWLARRVAQIDRTAGDIDTLSKRLAFIRTWTYVAQRSGWIDDESHWRGETRAVEDRLSDALHGALTQRFVDRRTSVLLRRLKQKETLVAEVNDKGEVTVEGEYIGRIEGFRFRRDEKATGEEAKTLSQAALQALAPEFHLRADRFYNSADTEFDFTEQGGLMWGNTAVGKLAAGPDVMAAQAVAFVDEEAGAEVAQKVQRRLQHFIDRKVAALFEPLLALKRDETLSGLARGVAFQMVEALGVIPRAEIAADIKALDQEARGMLRRHGVRFGQYTVFLPALLKPAPTRLRLVLASLFAGIESFPESPPPGLVTIPVLAEVPRSDYTQSGYHPAGSRAIRIDMLERLADLLRARDSRAGFEATPDMLSITGMTLEQFADLMSGLGYRAEKGERAKVKAADPATPPAPQEAPTAPQEAPNDLPPEGVPQPEETPADAPQEVPGETPADLPPADLPPEGVPEAPQEAPVDLPPESPIERPEEVPADLPSESPATPEPDLPGPLTAEATAEATEASVEAPETTVEPAEMEMFYTFTWAPRPRGQRPGGRRGDARDGQAREGQGRDGQARDGQARDGQGQGAQGRRDAEGRGEGRGDRPRGKGGKPGPKGPRGKGGKPPRPDENKARSFEARPPRREKKIDPDNPFAAALSGLKDKL